METRLQCCFEKIIIEFSVSCTEAKRKLEITFLGFHVIFFFPSGPIRSHITGRLYLFPRVTGNKRKYL